MLRGGGFRDAAPSVGNLNLTASRVQLGEGVTGVAQQVYDVKTRGPAGVVVFFVNV
jgi:hypothetical protein